MRELFATALAVARMELRSSLRDRQTLLYTVVLPFAMYPVLFWVLIQGAYLLRGSDEERAVRVAVAGAREAGLPPERVALALGERPAERPDLFPGPVSVALTPPGAGPPPRSALEGSSAALDALVELHAPPEPSLLFHDSTRPRSELALRRVRERLAALAEELRGEAMRSGGADPAALEVLAVRERDLSSVGERGAWIFSLILPMMFAFMAVLGAFFPAVDVTAGEKERGTMETTWLSPVPRAGLHLGKVLAVAGAAGIAATLNLLGMALAGEHLLAGLAGLGGGGSAFAIEIPWARLAAILPLGTLFLVTTSAVLVAGASFTDTFKQGQSLLGSVQLLLLAPAFVGVLPGVELSARTALVPVVQTVLACKAVLQDGLAVDPALVVLVGASQLVWAALVTWIALRLQASERRLLPRRALRAARRAVRT